MMVDVDVLLRTIHVIDGPASDMVWKLNVRPPAMPLVATGFVPQRMNEQRARERIARKHLFPDCLEVLTGLLFIPRCASGRKDFQPHRSRRIAFAGPERMAGLTAGVARAPGQENGVYLCPVELDAQSRGLGRG